jgi:replicative DNA helicase
MEPAHPSDLEQAHPRRGGGPRFRVLDPGETAAERPLPHSLDAEEHLLSILMLDGRDVMGKCQAAKMQPGWFYDSRHGTVFEALQELYRQGHALETATLAEHLRERGKLEQIGGYAMITQVSGRAPTSAQAEFFIAKVRDLAAMRRATRGAAGAASGVGGADDRHDPRRQRDDAGRRGRCVSADLGQIGRQA